jgi:hypothetical protein
MKLREGCMGAEICTPLNILNIDFRVMTPCSTAGGYGCIGRTAMSVFKTEDETGEAGLSVVIANKLTWQYGAKHRTGEAKFEVMFVPYTSETFVLPHPINALFKLQRIIGVQLYLCPRVI